MKEPVVRPLAVSGQRNQPSLPKVSTHFAVQQTTLVEDNAAASKRKVSATKSTKQRDADRLNWITHNMLALAYHESETRNLLENAENTARLVMVDSFEEGPGSLPLWPHVPTPPPPPSASPSPAGRRRNRTHRYPTEGNTSTGNAVGPPPIATVGQVKSPPVSAGGASSSSTVSSTSYSPNRYRSPDFTTHPAAVAANTLLGRQRQEASRRRHLESEEEDAFRRIKQGLEETFAMMRIEREDKERRLVLLVNQQERHTLEAQSNSQWNCCLATAFPSLRLLTEVILDQTEYSHRCIVEDEHKQRLLLTQNIMSNIHILFAQQQGSICTEEVQHRFGITEIEHQYWRALMEGKTFEVETVAVCCIQRSYRCYAAKMERKVRTENSVIIGYREGRNDILEEEENERVLLVFNARSQIADLHVYKADQVMSIFLSAEWASRSALMQEAYEGALRIGALKLMETALKGYVYIYWIIASQELQQRIELYALIAPDLHNCEIKEHLRRHASHDFDKDDENPRPMLTLMRIVNANNNTTLKWLDVMDNL